MPVGRSPVRILFWSLYYSATPAHEDSRCRWAYAVTEVGSAITWVCRNFAAVKAEQAARVLIHEALHHAGLPERPQTPDALSAREIDRLIGSRCGL